MRISLNFATLARIGILGWLSIAVAGCQTQQVVEQTPSTVSRSYMKLYHYDKADPQEGVSLVAQQEVLQRAIRHAFPEAAIKTDSGINLNQRVDVWANNLTPPAYLEHLASQANVSITTTGQNSIMVKSSVEQAFRFPAADAPSLVPHAERLAQSFGAHVLRLDDAHVLLVSGSPRTMAQVSRSFRQLNSRVTLEDVLGNSLQDLTVE